MEIPQIGVQNVNIPNIEAPGIYNYVPHTKVYPFILHIGSPVVDMPGCVKYHPDAAKNRETPNLKEEAPPKVEPPPEVDPPEVPPTGNLGKKEVECPGPGNLRVGDLTISGDEKVTGHELSADGSDCNSRSSSNTINIEIN